MTTIRSVLRIALILVLMGIFTWASVFAGAGDGERQTTIVVSFTQYEWWLMLWSDYSVVCRIFVDHEGLPTTEEVAQQCGGDIYTQWVNTPPCKGVVKGGNASSCDGYYLNLVASRPAQKELIVDLPTASVEVSLEGCNPSPPENRCTSMPVLVLSGIEPLPNETILAIEGSFDGLPFYCESAICKLPLRVTRPEGSLVEFWAHSSYGDQSRKFTAQVRVVDSGVGAAPGSSGWYVDVISTQWRGAPIATCAQTWQAFPPAGGLPPWLSSPDFTQLLASDQAYYYLAGRLIAQGLVDVTACSTGGLLPNGYADACGLEKARPQVQAWQNQFDQRILQVSKENGIPAQLLKNLFAQESQFWPGVFIVPYEFGLGQITDNGADAVLLWDTSFFEQFCPLVLANDACARGYLKLKPDEQAILRGALALEAKADCPTCAEGVDLTNVDFSVSLFAQTLKANCDQVAQIVYNATKVMPGVVSSYEDLWRFTIANYHAGPGCVSYAIHMAWQQSGDELITWENASQQLTPACQSVIPYVEKITR
jgi:hypothetical protein